MIIVKLFGGLGNQMFQYAFGKKMALKHNSDLKFDLSFYAADASRRYGLDCFAISAQTATADEIGLLKDKQASQSGKKINTLLRPKPWFIHQKGMGFNPSYFKTQKDVYIDGYWQSEKFFIDAAGPVRKDFRFVIPPSSNNELMLARIAGCNAISLHIRRGDFQSDKFINIHGTCPIAYYLAAVNMISHKVQNPVFFVFSDDMSWARENLTLDKETHFVDINDELSAYEDLRLMAACRHHILANSSFSWWGAWLNHRNDKMVIAPKTWFADQTLNQASAAIIPHNWIKL